MLDINLIDGVLDGFKAMSGWEYVAVVLGLLYLVLVMKQSLWCWPAAFASTLIYTLLFWQGALLMESLLSFYYLLMAIYGWWQWQKNSDAPEGNNKEIVSWSANTHIKWIATATILFVIIGYMMSEYTQAKMPYLDSFTTVFAVMTTYMVTQKVLENWLYWIVIDLASIVLYVEMSYYPTSVLYVLYTGLAWQGYKVWIKQNQTDNTQVESNA